MRRLVEHTVAIHRFLLENCGDVKAKQDFVQKAAELTNAIINYYTKIGTWDDVFECMVDLFNAFVGVNCDGGLTNQDELDYFLHSFEHMGIYRMQKAESQLVKEISNKWASSIAVVV